jgi:hypothetical protein
MRFRTRLEHTLVLGREAASRRGVDDEDGLPLELGAEVEIGAIFFGRFQRVEAGHCSRSREGAGERKDRWERFTTDGPGVTNRS